MDRKSIIALVVSFVVLMLWYPLVNKIYPPKPLPPGATNDYAAALSSTNRSASLQSAPAAAEAPATAAPRPVVTADAPESFLTVANDNARYTFTTHGGGLKLVELAPGHTVEEIRASTEPELKVAATVVER